MVEKATMKNIVIINNYGSMNIGDYAIQASGFRIIQQCLPAGSRIHLICEKPSIFSYPKQLPVASIVQLPYGSAIRPFRGKHIPAMIKIFRFLVIVSNSLFLATLGKLSRRLLPEKGRYAYIRLIADADFIIGMGGGFFVSKNKITDFYGLCLMLLPIYIGRLYHKKLLSLPITFGPFASSIHQKLALRAIEKSIILCRDTISVEIIKKLNQNKKNITTWYSPDLALHLPWDSSDIMPKLESKYFVLTARDWLPPKLQKHYEHALSAFVDHMWEKYKLKTVFIPNAFNPNEENDFPIAKRIKEQLHKKSIMTIMTAKTPFAAQKILSGARFSVCTRMHSAILSATVHTPFISIGYGFKALGLVKTLNLQDWYIDITEVSADILVRKATRLMRNTELKKYVQKLSRKLEMINAQKGKLVKELRKFVYE
jgi:polysaccharide pyruvyl transferase WcaK-like protein